MTVGIFLFCTTGASLGGDYLLSSNQSRVEGLYLGGGYIWGGSFSIIPFVRSPPAGSSGGSFFFALGEFFECFFTVVVSLAHIQ